VGLDKYKSKEEKKDYSAAFEKIERAKREIA
jgi:hypothetical protein